MNQSQIAIRYAKALFFLAQEKNKVDIIFKDVLLLNDTLINSSDLIKLLEHPVVKPSQKIQALINLFKDEVDQITLSFLQLIIQHKREIYLRRIVRNFIDLYKKNQHIQSVLLTSAYNLENEEKDKISETIESKLKSKIELNIKIDPAIIGGIILQINDKELDMSVSRQLSRVKSNLFEYDLSTKKKTKIS
ncbi:MAG: ATP synthase F1 subunit delta [Bacteroidales bacterium]